MVVIPSAARNPRILPLTTERSDATLSATQLTLPSLPRNPPAQINPHHDNTRRKILSHPNHPRYHQHTMATTASPSITAPDPLSMRAVLRIPMMRRLWYAQVISVFGDFLALFAVIGVLAFRLNATAQQVINLQIAYLLPIAVLGVIAGVFVDRWPLKPTMVSSDAIRCGLVLLLLTCTQLWQFYLTLAAISVISSFFGPAQGVAIRSAVPLHGLRSANALMQQVIFGMRIIGPALAALLVATFGPRICYLADAASFAGSALLIASISFVLPPAHIPVIPTTDSPVSPTEVEEPALSSSKGPASLPAISDPSSRPERSEVEAPAFHTHNPVIPTEGEAAVEGRASPTRTEATSAAPLARILTDMQQGFSFILHHAALLFVILALAAGMFVLGCFGPLIAVYVRDSVHASTRVYGFASAGIGLGLFVGINLLTVAGKRLPNNLLVYAGLGGIALGLALLTGLTAIWSTILGTITIGLATAGIILPSQVLIQTETPPALMGRVGSTVMSVIFSAQIAGLIVSGLLATHIGVRHVFAVCAILLALLIAAGRLFMEPKPTPA